MWRIAHDDEWGTLLPNLERWSDDIINVIEAFHLFVWLCEMGGGRGYCDASYLDGGEVDGFQLLSSMRGIYRGHCITGGR